MTRVEARYLSGDAVFLDNCETVGRIMVRIALLHHRFASDIAVVCPATGKELTDSPSEIPPALVSIVVKQEDAQVLGENDLRVTLQLHAEYGDIATCVRALDMLHRAHPEIETEFVTKMLHDAARRASDDQRNIVRTLVSAGVNAANALGRASWDGCTQAVEALLSAGVSPDARNEVGDPALMCATWNKRHNVVELLLSGGAHVDHADMHGDTPLTIASSISGGGHTDLMQVLLSAGAQVDHANMDGETGLTLASRLGNKKAVEVLLSAGAQVDHVNVYDETALLLASTNGHKDVTDVLLSAGAHVEHTNVNGDTPLIRASWTGGRDVVELLLSVGAHVDHANERGETALARASSSGYEDIVELLLSAGAHPDRSGIAD
eukprot:GEMP01038235.1.p1 GENE.GEMP01038235.1~~GEMP01038235.1.p1  ORF type:complete len:379 (+),score=101.33 GEMP01038235.1:104-1240(+)